MIGAYHQGEFAHRSVRVRGQPTDTDNGPIDIFRNQRHLALIIDLRQTRGPLGRQAFEAGAEPQPDVLRGARRDHFHKAWGIFGADRAYRNTLAIRQIE
jgi:hypothetical protein